jgi:glycosyltransferase involved in cell wall biosynthesis
VDVVIAVRNGERYIAQAVESVMAQTHRDWTIVAVDDGSTDGTAAVLEAFAARLGPSLRVIRQAGSGVAAARNAALRSSSGEFVAILDADDVWLPDRLAEGLKAMAREDVGLVHSRVLLIDPEGAPMGEAELGRPPFQGRMAPAIYRRSVYFVSPTVLVRRRALDEVGLFDADVAPCEDRDLWFRVAEKYEVAFVDKVLAHYRRHPQSATANLVRLRGAQIRFAEKHYGKPGCGPWARRAVLSSIYCEQGLGWLESGRRGRAFADVARALWLEPWSSRNLRALAKWGVAAFA